VEVWCLCGVRRWWMRIAAARGAREVIHCKGVKVHAHSSVALPLLATFSTSAAESSAAPVTTTLLSATVMSMFFTPAECP